MHCLRHAAARLDTHTRGDTGHGHPTPVAGGDTYTACTAWVALQD